MPGLRPFCAFIISIFSYIFLAIGYPLKFLKASPRSTQRQQSGPPVVADPNEAEARRDEEHRRQMQQLENEAAVKRAEMHRIRVEKAAEDDRRREVRLRENNEKLAKDNKTFADNLAKQNAKTLEALQAIKEQARANEAAMADANAAKLAEQDRLHNERLQEAKDQELIKQRTFDERAQAAEVANAQKRADHDVDMEHRRAEAARQQREHEERMRDAVRGADEARARRKRVADERRQQADAQVAQLMRMLAQKLWNERVEGGWANRLTFLRSCGNAVRRAFADLHNLIIYERERKKLSGEPADLEGVKAMALNLQSATDDYLLTLNGEVHQMRALHEQHHAPFLQDIENCAKGLVERCEDLRRRLLPFLKNGCNVDDVALEEVEEAMERLRRASEEIPTISHLKSRHRDWHRRQQQQQDSGGSEDVDGAPAQGVVIVEVDDDE